MAKLTHEFASKQVARLSGLRSFPEAVAARKELGAVLVDCLATTEEAESTVTRVVRDMEFCPTPAELSRLIQAAKQAAEKPRDYAAEWAAEQAEAKRLCPSCGGYGLVEREWWEFCACAFGERMCKVEPNAAEYANLALAKIRVMDRRLAAMVARRAGGS